MFNFLKRDPYHVFRKGKPGETKLKRAERRNKLRNKWFWKQNDIRYKKQMTENNYLANHVCPVCESRVTETYRNDPDNLCCGYTDYKCTRCGFIRSDWWDDIDDSDG